MEEQFAWQMNLYHWAMAVPVRQSILCILSPFRANPAYSGLFRSAPTNGAVFFEEGSGKRKRPCLTLIASFFHAKFAKFTQLRTA